MQFLRSARAITIIVGGGSACSYCAQQQDRQQWQAVITAAHRQAWDQDGIVVIDGLVPMHMVDAARRELLHLHHSGGLTGTVQGANIRRDKISWLGRSPAPPDLPTLGEGAKFLLRELPPPAAADGPPFALLKVDIEGGEYTLLPHLLARGA